MQADKTVQVRRTHDTRLVRVLALLVNDTYQWQHGWASWRIRFHYDTDSVDESFSRVSALVRTQALPLCQSRAEAEHIVLYLTSRDDLKVVFAAFDHGLRGLGRISAMQSRTAYLESARLALDLIEQEGAGRESAAEPASESELPDIRWTVSGSGLGRIATAMVRGKRLRVRMRLLNSGEVWAVDVDERLGCAHFRNRADALSKMGVGIALRSYVQARDQAERAG